MSALLLWLEAPLQSWGCDSRFGRRDTLPFPTRSGILGLLCCAMGRGGEQHEFLAAMKPCTQTIEAWARKTKQDKAIRQPLLMDFQVVGNGYDVNDPWENLLVPKTSEGKKPVGSGAKLTYRYYLQDMAFSCALEMPAGLESEAARALQDPIWPICLGRKNCVPSSPVFGGVFADEVAALKQGRLLAEKKERVMLFSVKTGRWDGGETMTLSDVPVCFGVRKHYEDRVVTVFPAAAHNEME